MEQPVAADKNPLIAGGSGVSGTAVPKNSTAEVQNSKARESWSDDPSWLAHLEETLEAMRRILDERLQYDAAKEEAFNRLYAELDSERKKAAGEALKPVVRDLVLLHDHIVEAKEQDPGATSALEMIRQGLLEVLSRAGAEVLGPAPDNHFDRVRQSVKRVVKTDVPELDWVVTQVLREGFLFNGTVLRPQQVEVQRFSKPQLASADAPAGAGEKTN